MTDVNRAPRGRPKTSMYRGYVNCADCGTRYWACDVALAIVTIKSVTGKCPKCHSDGKFYPKDLTFRIGGENVRCDLIVRGKDVETPIVLGSD